AGGYPAPRNCVNRLRHMPPTFVVASRQRGSRRSPLAATNHSNKYGVIAQYIATTRPSVVLDVGCRDGILREAIQHHAAPNAPAYIGADLEPQAASSSSTVGCDLGAGLPFVDESVDLVVALDVVEHVDDFKHGLEELVRVSGRYVALTLPNMAHFL